MLDVIEHPWKELTKRPCAFSFDGKLYHEIFLRSFHVLAEVRSMLERGDSAKTIIALIDFVNQSEQTTEKR